MEELNKNQIVLLTLLVSFVTSIATGIVTVTLMESAPAQVTQTINRVVERTIEKAVPGETKVTTVVKEVPVVVTEEKLIVDVINNTSPGAVRIMSADGKTNLATGFIVSKGGLVVTSMALLLPPIPPPVTPPEGSATGAADQTPPEPLPPPTDYQIMVGGLVSLPAKLVKADAKTGVATLQLQLGEFKEVAEIKPASANAAFKSPVVLKLTENAILPGQTVVALGLPDAGPINVSGGLISSLFTDSEQNTLIRTSAANVSNLGGPIFNTAGEVVGLARDVGTAIDAETIRQTLK